MWTSGRLRTVLLVVLLTALAPHSRASAPVCKTYSSPGQVETSTVSVRDTIAVRDAFAVTSAAVSVDLTCFPLSALSLTLSATPIASGTVDALSSPERSIALTQGDASGTPAGVAFHTISFNDSAVRVLPRASSTYEIFSGPYLPLQRLSLLYGSGSSGSSLAAGSGGSAGLWTLTAASEATSTGSIALNGWSVTLCADAAESPTANASTTSGTSTSGTSTSGTSTSGTSASASASTTGSQSSSATASSTPSGTSASTTVDGQTTSASSSGSPSSITTGGTSASATTAASIGTSSSTTATGATTTSASPSTTTTTSPTAATASATPAAATSVFGWTIVSADAATATPSPPATPPPPPTPSHATPTSSSPSPKPSSGLFPGGIADALAAPFKLVPSLIKSTHDYYDSAFGLCVSDACNEQKEKIWKGALVVLYVSSAADAVGVSTGDLADTFSEVREAILEKHPALESFADWVDDNQIKFGQLASGFAKNFTAHGEAAFKSLLTSLGSLASLSGGTFISPFGKIDLAKIDGLLSGALAR